MTLQGKRVLITGGGSGVGADLARGFAKAGAEVVISGRRLDALQKIAAETGAKPVVADVSDEQSVKQMFAAAGRCQIVIANAGAAESAPALKTTLDQWNAMLAVNLTGTFLTLRDGLRQLDGYGRLIVIASLAGLKGYPYVSAYVAAKHGAVGLVRSFALEVALKDITVNAICPGFLETEMTDRTIANIMEKTGKSQSEAIAAIVGANPQKRLIPPREITQTALWLCDDNARSINGQAISLSGGE